jgi:hypothetical protein
VKLKISGGRVWLWLAPLLFILSLAFMNSIHYPIWMDEYVFYRLSSELPDYSSTTDWFYEDRPEIMNASVDWTAMGFDYDAALRLTYDTPIFHHTPLPTILVWPIVKGLNTLADYNIIPHIEEQPGAYLVRYNPDGTFVDEKEVQTNILNQHAETITIILRCIPLFLFALSMWLIYKMMAQRVGLNAMLFILPVAVSDTLLSGSYMFYWDAFMMFFFVLTLYLMERYPKGKWHYLTACMMINTKMFIPFLFLIPLVVKGFTQSKRKGFLMFLPGFSVLPFYVVTAVVTGDIFAPFTHYLEGMWIHDFIYTVMINPMNLLNFGTIAYLLMTLPILWFYKKYPVFATAYLVGMIYGWCTGLGITQLSVLLYVGALVVPLVGGEFHFMERVDKWVSPKKRVELADG